MALELGSHPKPPQIADVLVYVGGRGMLTCEPAFREDSLGRDGMFYTACL